MSRYLRDLAKPGEAEPPFDPNAQVDNHSEDSKEGPFLIRIKFAEAQNLMLYRTWR